MVDVNEHGEDGGQEDTGSDVIARLDAAAVERRRARARVEALLEERRIRRELEALDLFE